MFFLWRFRSLWQRLVCLDWADTMDVKLALRSPRRSRRRVGALVCFGCVLACSDGVDGLEVAPGGRPQAAAPSRRGALAGTLAFAAVGAPSAGAVAAGEFGLRDTLAARDATLLKKPFIQVPPGPTAYPAWLEGAWRCDASFAGFELPSKKISRERVVANTDLPGFTKLSVARFADVGREATRYTMNFYRDPKNGAVLEDYASDLASSLAAHANDPNLVRGVSYEVAKNPNRATLNLREGSRNGERIEIFVNGRRSETLSDDIFLNSESIRQVTLGQPTASNPGVARIVIGEYQHYFTWRRTGADSARLNVLTAVYVEPQDPMFGDAFDLPVVVYAHNVQLSRAPPPGPS